MAAETPEEFRLEVLREAVRRVENDAKEFEGKLERDAKSFEERLERRFDDYVLTLVFNNYKEYLDQRLKPLEKIVYGLVALVLTTVVCALLALVIMSK